MKNKVLVYDLSCTQPMVGKYHGGGLYGEVLFLNLLEKLENDSKVIAFYYKDKQLSSLLLDACQKYNVVLFDITGDNFQTAITKISPKIYITVLPTKKRIINNPGTLMLTVCHDLRTTEIAFDRFSYSLSKSTKDILFLFDSIFFNAYSSLFYIFHF